MLQRLAIALMIVSVVVIFASVPLAYWLSTHHEALALPTVVECDRGNDVVDVRVTSNRAHGSDRTAQVCRVRMVLARGSASRVADRSR